MKSVTARCHHQIISARYHFKNSLFTCETLGSVICSLFILYLIHNTSKKNVIGSFNNLSVSKPIITVSITKHAPRNAQGDCLVIYYFPTKRKPERVATSPAIPGRGSARWMVQILRFLVILEKKKPQTSEKSTCGPTPSLRQFLETPSIFLKSTPSSNMLGSGKFAKKTLTFYKTSREVRRHVFNFSSIKQW